MDYTDDCVNCPHLDECRNNEFKGRCPYEPVDGPPLFVPIDQ